MLCELVVCCLFICRNVQCCFELYFVLFLESHLLSNIEVQKKKHEKKKWKMNFIEMVVVRIGHH